MRNSEVQYVSSCTLKFQVSVMFLWQKLSESSGVSTKFQACLTWIQQAIQSTILISQTSN